MTGCTGLLGLNAPVGLQKLSKVIRIGDSLPFSDDQAGGIDHFILLKVNLGFVAQIVDLLERTKVLLRCPVAVKAPSHRVALGMIDLLHLVNVSVTAFTGDATIQVRRVIEIDVVRGFVDPHPLDRLTLDGISVGIKDWAVKVIDSHSLTKSSQFGRSLLDVLVTVPASIGRGNIGVPGMFHEAMAVAAIHAQLTGVKTVVKVDGLGWLVSHTLSLGGRVVGDSGNYGCSKCAKTNRYFERQ